MTEEEIKVIHVDTPGGFQEAKRHSAKHSTQRIIDSEDLYNFTLDMSPISFQTITDEEKEKIRNSIDIEVKKKPEELVERGKKGQLSIRMELFFGFDRRLSDVDNLTKSILDLMKGIVYEDDKIVRHIDILRNETDIGQITITIGTYKSQMYGYSTKEDIYKLYIIKKSF